MVTSGPFDEKELKSPMLLHSEVDRVDIPVRVLIAGPTGYDKTTRLQELAARRTDVVVVTDSVSARAALKSGNRTATVVADAIHAWPREDQYDLARLVTFEQHPGALLLAGRCCDPKLYHALVLVRADIVSTDELRFGVSELSGGVASIEVGDEQLRLLEQLSDGWPRLGRSLVDHVTGAGSASGLSFAHPCVVAAVESCLRDLDAEDLRLLEQIAHLESFSERVTEALSQGLLERLRMAGVPIEWSSACGIRLINPVREYLCQRSYIDADLVPRMAVALVQSGLPLDAIRLLIRTDRSDRAAQMLTGLTLGQLDAIPPQDLLATLDLMPEQHDKFLRLHLARARALGNAARIGEQLEVIHKVIAVAERTGDDAIRLEAQAERLFHRAMSAERGTGLLGEIQSLEAQVNRKQIAIRLMEARSLVHAQSDDPDDVAVAVVLSEHASATWESLGERIRAATAMRSCAMAMLMPMGRLRDAGATIEHALRLTPTADLERLSSLVVSVRLDALLARNRADRLSEAAALAQGLGLRWAEAYVFWALAMHHGVARDPTAVSAAFERAWDLLGELRDHPTGALMSFEVVESLARAGDLVRARNLLERVHPRRAECPEEYAAAELALAARSRDGSNIEPKVDAFEAGLKRWPGWRWKLSLYLAVAAEGESRAELAARAADHAEPWADRDIVTRLEPDLFSPDVTVRLAGDAGAPPQHVERVRVVGVVEGQRTDHDTVGVTAIDGVGPGDRSPRIRLLGCFDVAVDGRSVPISSERVAALVKTVAIGRGRVSVDVAVDRLWPDAQPTAGRRRLKNVLTRTRHLLGLIIEREGDMLHFADDVVLDLAEFATARRTAIRAFADGEASAVASAIQALGLYTGPLLPDDLYDDHVAPVRVAEACGAMSLVDVLLTSSAGAIIGPTIHDAIIRIDSYDAQRLERLIEWSMERGEPGLARSAALRLAAIADEFDLELLPSVRALVVHS